MVTSQRKSLGPTTIFIYRLRLLRKDALFMNQWSFSKFIGSYGFHLSYIMVVCCFPTYAAEPIDGFRDLKFGMTPEKVKALTTCTTSDE